MKKQKVRYYLTETDDFTVTKNQQKQLPKDYKWIKTDIFSKILSKFVYALAIIISPLFCKLHLHLKIKKSANIKKLHSGCFIYANHTQPIGDVFIPALAVFPKRIYTIVSTANYGIRVIGKILPYLGALPIVDTFAGMKELQSAINIRYKNGNPIVIFPEAHVWEYCAEIRNFDATSFKYPAKLDAPVLTLTATYKKSRMLSRPIMEVYLDGPIYPQGENTHKKAEYLHKAVRETMYRRSTESNTEYIKYIKKTDNTIS